MSAHHDGLIGRCRELPAMRTAIVYPCDELALESALVAGAAGIVVPVLVGDPARMTALARDRAVHLESCEIVAAADPRAAAVRSVELARNGEVQAIMKGSLHSDELLHAIASPDSGLHTGRRLTHAYVMDVPSYAEPLLVTDAVVNIAPSLDEKREIAQNAIDLARALYVEEVRVAVLSAIETVSARIGSTLDAAALCKMCNRGQITGALVDGPLALDDAVSTDAAREKNIVSAVAGRANVLLVPDFESGNMLAKALILLAKARAAGVVLGAAVPIAFTSRADSIATHVASLAVARLLAARVPATLRGVPRHPATRRA